MILGITLILIMEMKDLKGTVKKVARDSVQTAKRIVIKLQVDVDVDGDVIGVMGYPIDRESGETGEIFEVVVRDVEKCERDNGWESFKRC